MLTHKSLAGAAIVFAIGCASAPPPIALDANPADLAPLVGEWHGEYGSTASGRHGSILFALNAGRDSAFGEVLMVPAGYAPPRNAQEASQQLRRPIPEILTIAFVHAEGGSLTGQLAPYRDPDCGCPVNTVFTGRFTGPDTIEGTFVTTGPPMHERQSGEWKVTRVSSRR